MEQSANISRVFHARMISLLTILWVADVMFLIFSLNTIFIEGPTVMIMFASEVSSSRIIETHLKGTNRY